MLTVSDLAALLALFAAISFALASHVLNTGQEGANTFAGTFICVLSCAICFWCLAPWFIETRYWLTWAALIFAGAGLIRPTFSTLLGIASIRYLGPTMTTALSASAPLFAALLAVLVLGETLTWKISLGTMLVIGSVAIGATAIKNQKTDLPHSVSHWAIMLPIGAASIRAVGHIATKYGLAEVPSSFFATLVGSSVSVISSYALLRHQRNAYIPWTKNWPWFVAGGILSALALYLANTALQLGRVVVVVPIVATVPIFTLLLSALLFRRENITWVTFITIILVLLGVCLLTAS